MLSESSPSDYLLRKFKGLEHSSTLWPKLLPTMCRSLLTWAMAAALPLLIDARAGSAPFPEIPNAEAVAAAAKIPTSFNTGACRFNTVSKFFPAVVNYAIFDGNWNDPNQTFFQQYHIVDEFWQPGGPILFYQGGEGPLYCPSAFGYLTDLTKEFVRYRAGLPGHRRVR